MSPTVMRGSSDEYGSWKTICMSRRSFADLAARQLGQLLAHEPHRPARRLDQLEHAVAGRRLAGAGLADEARASCPRGIAKLTPSTALTALDRALERAGLREPESASSGRRRREAARCSFRGHRRLSARSDAGCADRTQWPVRISRSCGGSFAQESLAFRERAARREAARLRRVGQVGRTARDRGQPAFADSLALDLRQRPEQRLGVRMLRVVEQVERRRPARRSDPRT